MWIKIGILLSGFIYAGVLPQSIRKTLKHVHFDLKAQTISFISNKNLYGKEYLRKYKRFLFVTAIITLLFFRLLIAYYDLKGQQRLLAYADYSVIFLVALAFVPHNLKPYSFENFGKSLQRLLHNMLGLLVFVSLPLLIISFQITVWGDRPFMGIFGSVIIGIMLLIMIWSIIRHGFSGVTELMFINGISVWIIFATLYTFLCRP